MTVRVRTVAIILGLLVTASAVALAAEIPLQDTVYRIYWREGFRKAEYFEDSLKRAPQLYENYKIVPRSEYSTYGIEGDSELAILGWIEFSAPSIDAFKAEAKNRMPVGDPRLPGAYVEGKTLLGSYIRIYDEGYLLREALNERQISPTARTSNKILGYLKNLFIFPFAQAKFPTEDFENYSTGDLNGAKTGWIEAWGASDGCDSSFKISSTTVHGGSRAITGSSNNSSCSRKFEAVNTDNSEVSWYVRAGQTSGAGSNTWWKDTGANAWVVIAYMRADGYLMAYNGHTAENIQPYSANTWYQTRVKCDFTNERFRIQYDSGGYSDWKNMYDYQDSTLTKTDEVKLYWDAGGYTFYWDDFADITP